MLDGWTSVCRSSLHAKALSLGSGGISRPRDSQLAIGIADQCARQTFNSYSWHLLFLIGGGSALGAPALCTGTKIHALIWRVTINLDCRCCRASMCQVWQCVRVGSWDWSQTPFGGSEQRTGVGNKRSCQILCQAAVIIPVAPRCPTHTCSVLSRLSKQTLQRPSHYPKTSEHFAYMLGESSPTGYLPQRVLPLFWSKSSGYCRRNDFRVAHGRKLSNCLAEMWSKHLVWSIWESTCGTCWSHVLWVTAYCAMARISFCAPCSEVAALVLMPLAGQQPCTTFGLHSSRKLGRSSEQSKHWFPNNDLS